MMNTLTDYRARHFLWSLQGGIGRITLNRPEKKNPLTFESYAELRDLMRRLPVRGRSEGDCHQRCGREFLLRRRCAGNHRTVDADEHARAAQFHSHDRRSGESHARLPPAHHCRGRWRVRRRRRHFGHVLRHPLEHASFQNRVPVHARRARGLRHGRLCDSAAHHRPWTRRGIALSGRSMGAEEALACGFYSRVLPAEELPAAATQLAQELADGPTFAHGMTKTMLNQEWNMGLEQALEAEAQAQAICMQTEDFRRAYAAFSAKQRPAFKGN